jgi:hypothetical protein
MMINGAHAIIYSRDADADRAFLRDVLRFPAVDVGGGWLIFGLPPAEVAVHPGEKNDVHEFYLMCDDVRAFVAEMETRQVACEAVKDQGWGLLTSVRLPGGGRLGVYQPRHPRPDAIVVRTARRSAKKRKTAAAKRPRAARSSVGAGLRTRRSR